MTDKLYLHVDSSYVSYLCSIMKLKSLRMIDWDLVFCQQNSFPKLNCCSQRTFKTPIHTHTHILDVEKINFRSKCQAINSRHWMMSCPVKNEVGGQWCHTGKIFFLNFGHYRGV